MTYIDKITETYNVPCVIPAIPESTFDVKFKIVPNDSVSGGTTYRMSGDFPKNFSIRRKNFKDLSERDEYTLDIRSSYEIYMNDKLMCRLVPVVHFTMYENNSKNESKEVRVADFFTYEQFDRLTICLTTTSNFDDLVLILATNDIECHKYDNKYYLPIENQQYYVKNLKNIGDDYFIFQRTTFELNCISYFNV